MDGLADWYLLGAALGLGVAAGIPGRPGVHRFVALAFLAVALAGTLVIGLAATAWAFVAGPAGAALGAISFRRLSTAAVPAAALATALLAAGPGAGYLEALAAPLLGGLLHRRAGTRYAGLRVLAKD